MNTTKLSYFLDVIFYFLVIFFVSIIWLRFHLHSSTTIIILSVLIALISSLILYKIKDVKKNKIINSKQEMQQIKNFTIEMMYLTEKEQCEKLCLLLNIPKTCIKKNFIFYKNIAIKPFYLKNELSNVDIIKTISQLNNNEVEKLILCAPNFDQSCNNFYNQKNNMRIFLINEIDIFNYVLKPINYKSNLLFKPEIKRKQHFKQLISIAFNNKRTKGYFFSAFILFLCSLVFRYNIYYIVLSSILFIFALISKFNKKYNINKSNNAFNFTNSNNK